jgi:hypothetical protein
MKNDQIPTIQQNLPQNPEIIEPLNTLTKPKISKLSILIILLIAFVCFPGIIYLYSKNKESQQKQISQLEIPTPLPSQTTSIPSLISPNPNIEINAENEKCPLSPTSLQDSSYPKNISQDGTLCKFSMFDGYDKNKTIYTILYPQKWQASIVGAAYANLNFQKSSTENVLMIDMVTKLPLASINKAEYCYEGCSPIINKNEIEISKTIKTFDKIKVMEVISSLDRKQIKRYFYPTNHKYDNGNQLFVFEYTPTNPEFDTEVVGLIKSLVEYPTK